jgi:hypothetical protein
VAARRLLPTFELHRHVQRMLGGVGQIVLVGAAWGGVAHILETRYIIATRTRVQEIAAMGSPSPQHFPTHRRSISNFNIERVDSPAST